MINNKDKPIWERIKNYLKAYKQTRINYRKKEVHNQDSRGEIEIDRNMSCNISVSEHSNKNCDSPQNKNRRLKVLMLKLGSASVSVLVIVLVIVHIQGRVTAEEETQYIIHQDSNIVSSEAFEQSQDQEIVKQAEQLALGYDYDGAIEFIKAQADYDKSTTMLEAIKRYEETKSTLVVYPDVTTIPHVFFHSLIVDTDKAFDGDSKEAGYNQVMTTVDEFNAMMQQMYDRGYVLVSIKDMAVSITAEDDSTRFAEGEIMLPEGKKPFVLSVDDVSYYEYMKGDGFASRIVLDENGRPTCEMELDDGTIVTGDFDVIPCLESFIEEHPDFSYKGARGILALTGYEGVLGYRTAPSYSESETYSQDVEAAKKVAEGLKEWGWEFASHSYGHLNLGNISFEKLQEDTTKWKETVESIIGTTDILIFPFGNDINDWHDYSGERFDYLKSQGFNYFCNVDSVSSWVQIRDNYVRQGRRNLDGLRMYNDMINDDVNLLSDLFDVSEVFDERRPVPVPKL